MIKTDKIKTIIFSCVILVSSNVNTQIDTLNQSVISSAGEILKSENYIINFTLGEFATQTLTMSDKIISQGFHQTGTDIINSSSEEELPSVIIYPNPTTDIIHIDLSELISRDLVLTLTVYNMSASKILQFAPPLNSQIINANLSQLLSGEYVMRITSSAGMTIYSTKIIKI